MARDENKTGTGRGSSDSCPAEKWYIVTHEQDDNKVTRFGVRADTRIDAAKKVRKKFKLSENDCLLLSRAVNKKRIDEVAIPEKRIIY